MGKVRKFEINDIEQVVDLNIKSFVRSKDLTRNEQYELFKEVCFNNPWYDEEVRSLVYEDSNGRIKGFLCVIPKKFKFNGEDILVGVSQHLMVDQVPLASLQLFREFFSGPQDLSITDMSVDIGKPLWERLGGSAIYLHSIYWRKPLRILSFLGLMLFKNIYSKKYFFPVKVFFKVSDYAVSKIPSTFLRIKNDGVLLEKLDENDFLSNIELFMKGKSLIPVYNTNSISWLYKRLRAEKRFGKFQSIKVLSIDGDLLGWFLYNLLKDGTSHVIQVVAHNHSVNKVYQALFYDAFSKGSIELVGRLDPNLSRMLFVSKCFFMPGRNWMLAYSRNKEIINSLHSNNAFFTRLEGDLWFL